jgi:predicted transporter
MITFWQAMALISTATTILGVFLIGYVIYAMKDWKKIDSERKRIKQIS